MEIFKIVMLIIGSIIGAGFASGKETEVFFTSLGQINIVALILLFILFYITIKQFLYIGNKYEIDNIYTLNKHLFNKHYKIFDAITTLNYFIICGAMISGFTSLLKNIFSGIILYLIIFLILCVLVFITTQNLNFISILNALFIPAIILFIIVLFFFTCNVHSIKIETNFVVSLKQIIYVFFYVGINIYLSAALISSCKIKKYKITSFITSGLLFILVLLANFILNTNNTHQADMPYLFLSEGIGSALFVICFICIFLGIFTTVISTTKILERTLNKQKNKNVLFYSIIVVGVSFLISLMGFSNIVKYLYPVIGCIGFYYCFKAILINKKY